MFNNCAPNYLSGYLKTVSSSRKFILRMGWFCLVDSYHKRRWWFNCFSGDEVRWQHQKNTLSVCGYCMRLVICNINAWCRSGYSTFYWYTSGGGFHLYLFCRSNKKWCYDTVEIALEKKKTQTQTHKNGCWCWPSVCSS